MTDEQRQLLWLTAEHAALASEFAVATLGPATQDTGLAAALIDAAHRRRIADDLYQDIVLRLSSGAATRQIH